QLNDTHPVIALAECIRLLTERGVDFETSIGICGKMFFYTNHTVMAEALERWQGKTLRKILPKIWKILLQIQEKLQKEVVDESLYIIQDDVVYMANLAFYVCGKVNGVARLHTEILKEKVFAAWHSKYPEKLINVTNGITPRRWFMLANPRMAEEVSARIGEGWKEDLRQLSALKKHVYDEKFRTVFREIKRHNKKALADYIRRREKVDLDENFLFDIQIKRLHEYKRQLLNGLSVLYLYYEIKEGRLKDFHPTAFIFGAKSAPGYGLAKGIIKFLNEIAKKVNGDKSVADKLKMVFVQNYDVSYAEKLVCAADVSEQISTVGLEASGTGNMKFMLNGTVTLGTEDGANVEIFAAAGKENNYPFRLTIDEVEEARRRYDPTELLKRNPRLTRVVETLIDGTFDDGDTG
ncbi:MAG: glycogen/starch/alpha-glucan phosphorylase, partial [Clostridia bacterium]|nr:glycogen/starch/alpha-glucan phosphorylase [Clostridia bacterium]